MTDTTPPLDLDGTTVFDRDRKASVRMLALSAAFVGLGIWFIVASETFATSSLGYRVASLGLSPSGAIVALGVIAVAFGVAAGAGWVRHRRNAAPVAVLRPSGLTVDAGTLRVSDLPWSEVVGTQRLSIAGQDLLGIRVADAERVLAEQGPVGRLTGRMNARSYQTPVYVAASLVTDPLDALDAAVRAYAERYGAA